MIKAIKTYLREIAANGGRGGTHDSRSRKGFGSAPLSAEARAKALATRSANRAREERETLRQAVIRAQKRSA
jgi:ribose 1,5-bisphosphokinase PhnN